jgi:hypothetical protein
MLTNQHAIGVNRYMSAGQAAGLGLRIGKVMSEGTTRSTVLTVRVDLTPADNELRERFSDEEMKRLRLQHPSLCPQWAYTLRPQPLRKLKARWRLHLVQYGR